MRSEMTLRGLYNYDPDILGPLVLPEGVHRQHFINYLLMETEGLELLYPDPDFLKQAIYSWSTMMWASWLRIREALYATYNPIENYDRNESWTDNNTRTDNTTTKRDGSSTGSGSVTGTNGSTNQHFAKGYNSGTLILSEKEQIDGNTSNTTSDSLTTSDTVTNTGTVGNAGSHTGRVHGNIGVTTNQQMITQEIEMRVNYQFETSVANQFKEKFCLLVY